MNVLYSVELAIKKNIEENNYVLFALDISVKS